MQKYNNIKKTIKKDLVELDKILVNRLDSDIALIKQISKHIISSGGKRLRPILLMLCARANDYKGVKHHSMAAVIEIIHTATLLHDDVVDESKIRRGKQTAHKIWGSSASVLVGDFLYSRSFQIMLDSESMEIIKLLSETTNTIAEGEIMQLINIKNIKISPQEYFDVIERKTACLFKTACEIGAILANADAKTIKSLGSFGMHLGNAFQIIDDVLEYEQNSKDFDKDFYNDLKEGKITLPVIYALKNCSKDDYKILIEIIQNPSKEKVAQVIDILIKTNAFDFTKKIAQDEAKKALNFLTGLPKSKYLSAMQDLCKLSLNRKY